MTTRKHIEGVFDMSEEIAEDQDMIPGQVEVLASIQKTYQSLPKAEQALLGCTYNILFTVTNSGEPQDKQQLSIDACFELAKNYLPVPDEARRIELGKLALDFVNQMNELAFNYSLNQRMEHLNRMKEALGKDVTIVDMSETTPEELRAILEAKSGNPTIN